MPKTIVNKGIPVTISIETVEEFQIKLVAIGRTGYLPT